MMIDDDLLFFVIVDDGDGGDGDDGDDGDDDDVFCLASRAAVVRLGSLVASQLYCSSRWC